MLRNALAKLCSLKLGIVENTTFICNSSFSFLSRIKRKGAERLWPALESHCQQDLLNPLLNNLLVVLSNAWGVYTSWYGTQGPLQPGLNLLTSMLAVSAILSDQFLQDCTWAYLSAFASLVSCLSWNVLHRLLHHRILTTLPKANTNSICHVKPSPTTPLLVKLLLSLLCPHST